MPYSAKHKQQTRATIVEAARVLFNRHGFENVTIDGIMNAAGLTRGGFYNHFESKEELFAESISCFLTGRGAEHRQDAQVDEDHPDLETVSQMIQSYLSTKHLENIDGQCPLIALPTDVARASENVRRSYQRLLESLVWLFEQGLSERGDGARSESARTNALSLAALCIGGMTLARTLPDSALADEIRLAALAAATGAVGALGPV